MAEVDRDALFTVDVSNPQTPRVVVGEGVDELQIEALTEGATERGVTHKVANEIFDMIDRFANYVAATRAREHLLVVGLQRAG